MDLKTIISVIEDKDIFIENCNNLFKVYLEYEDIEEYERQLMLNVMEHIKEIKRSIK